MKNMSAGMRVAVLLMMISFLYIFVVTIFNLPKAGMDIAKIVVPFLLGTIFGTLINFYYGKKHEQPPTIEDRRKDNDKS